MLKVLLVLSVFMTLALVHSTDQEDYLVYGVEKSTSPTTEKSPHDANQESTTIPEAKRHEKPTEGSHEKSNEETSEEGIEEVIKETIKETIKEVGEEIIDILSEETSLEAVEEIISDILGIISEIPIAEASAYESKESPTSVQALIREAHLLTGDQ